MEIPPNAPNGGASSGERPVPLQTAQDFPQEMPFTPAPSVVDSIPVFVMLPLDTINADGVFKYASSRWFLAGMQQLKDSGIHGVAVDVWWGAVERRPRRYDWSGYRQLFELITTLGLKLQVVMAFHACGGNVGDNAELPLPCWVTSAGERDPDIFFTDRPRESTPGQRNRECISLFAAEEPGLLKGRSAMQCYVDFMRAFRDEFMGELGTLIEEVVVGSGPCGELRFPSYPEPNGWRFPGIGEFQCYDRRALASLARAAVAVGRPEWGNAGPHDAGTYNCSPEETGFFRGWGGRWDTEYGRFFLRWYSQALLEHGDRMLGAAASVFNLARKERYDSGVTLDTTMSGDDSIEGWPWRQGSGGGASGQGSLRGGNGASTGSLEGFGNGGSVPPFSSGVNGRPPSLPDLQLPPPNSPSALSSPPGSLNSGLPPGTGVSRPASYASFRSSSVSEGLNALEDWTWPSPAGPPVGITLKIAGVHWWYRTRSHAAEVTAGYYNAEGTKGYDAIVGLCARYGASLTLTCVEMCDSQHPPEALCGPEGLLRQVREVAAAAGVAVGGENALPCFMPNVIDEIALQRVVYNTQPWGTPLQQGSGATDAASFGALAPPAELISTAESAVPALGSSGETIADRRLDAKLPCMRSFTFLRLTPDMVSPSYFDKWTRFMGLMAHNGQKFKTSPRWRQNMGFSSPQ